MGRNGDHMPETREQSPLRHHFQKADVLDTLRMTLEVVDELDPPEDLRLATFNGAFGMFGQFYDARAAAMAGMGIVR